MKFAFIFPGQGCQSVGMGREFYENSASARALLDEASEFTGIDFKNLLFEPSDKLDVSEFTQPAIALNSMMALAALQERADQEKLSI
ncbi:acyltransferase domain-containing protein, partial [uncultured Campylobacter sp.]|uniref:ACP S-malonyltransferase n=1 Tax=uncultured Campylobacter sp. TaxID=218934 RepID=UPI0026226855